MVDGERLRDQTAKKIRDMRFLDAEGLNQRGSIVTHILERVGLPDCVYRQNRAGLTMGEALFKLGGERRK